MCHFCLFIFHLAKCLPFSPLYNVHVEGFISFVGDVTGSYPTSFRLLCESDLDLLSVTFDRSFKAL